MTAISAICHPLPRVPLIRIPKDLSWVIPAHPRLAWSSATAATKLSKSVQLPPFLTGRKITHFTIYSPFCQPQIFLPRSAILFDTPASASAQYAHLTPFGPSILGIWILFSRALFLIRGRQSSRCGMLAQGDQPFRPADVLSPDWRLLCEGITNGWFVGPSDQLSFLLASGSSLPARPARCNREPRTAPRLRGLEQKPRRKLRTGNNAALWIRSVRKSRLRRNALPAMTRG